MRNYFNCAFSQQKLLSKLPSVQCLILGLSDFYLGANGKIAVFNSQILFVNDNLFKSSQFVGIDLHQIPAELDCLDGVGRHFNLGLSRRSLPKGTASNFGGNGAETE